MNEQPEGAARGARGWWGVVMARTEKGARTTRRAAEKNLSEGDDGGGGGMEVSERARVGSRAGVRVRG